MRKNLLLCLAAFSITLMTSYSCGGNSKDDTDPEVPVDPPVTQKDTALSAWKSGWLEIHAISTGKGECTFMIFPDGTSMIIDAASAIDNTDYKIDAVPNDTKRPSQWIAQYINHCINPLGKSSIDYAMLTHFHADHLGTYDTALNGYNPTGGYYLNGITDILDDFKVGTMLDRGYPDYNYPSGSPNTSAAYTTNYRKCAKWHADNDGMKIERFKVGTKDQIALKYSASEYPEFQVRNLVCNGTYWTGTGDETKDQYPANLAYKSGIDENEFSAGIKVSYGKFDYFTAGDLTCENTLGSTWADIEGTVADVVGEVDVMKADHHGSVHANGAHSLEKLSPDAVIVHSWRTVQPRANDMEVFTSSATNSGKTKVFTTYLNTKNAATFGTSLNSIMNPQGGHIVIKVHPGGNVYDIYVLSDKDTNYYVQKKFGPYKCK